jgi:hypothetical protein
MMSLLAEEDITLGALQGSRRRVFVIFAANLAILRCLRHAVFLLALLQFACRTLKAVTLGATTVTSSGDKVSSALTLWSMADAGKEVVKVP